MDPILQSMFEELARGYFYSKQWKVSEYLRDGIVVRETDYPVLPNWRELYHRQARVQVAFFEAMYLIGAQTTP